MNSTISSYLKIIIIDNAKKTKDGFSLHIEDINSNEQQTIADFLFNHDPVMKELVLDRIQELIEEKLPLVDAEYNYDMGLRPIHDSQTGEVTWIRG